MRNIEILTIQDKVLKLVARPSRLERATCGFEVRFLAIPLISFHLPECIYSIDFNALTIVYFTSMYSYVPKKVGLLWG